MRTSLMAFVLKYHKNSLTDIRSLFTQTALCKQRYLQNCRGIALVQVS